VEEEKGVRKREILRCNTISDGLKYSTLSKNRFMEQ